METADDLVRQGQKLETTKSFAQAIEKFRQAATIASGRLDAYSGLARCAESVPDAYYKAVVSKSSAVADSIRLSRESDITVNKSRLNEEFLVAVGLEQRRLKDQIERVKRLMAEARIDSPTWFTDDELRLLAGARVLKEYGFATATLNVDHGKCCDLVAEVVKTDFSAKDLTPSGKS